MPNWAFKQQKRSCLEAARGNQKILPLFIPNPEILGLGQTGMTHLGVHVVEATLFFMHPKTLPRWVSRVYFSKIGLLSFWSGTGSEIGVGLLKCVLLMGSVGGGGEYRWNPLRLGYLVCSLYVYMEKRFFPSRNILEQGHDANHSSDLGHVSFLVGKL